MFRASLVFLVLGKRNICSVRFWENSRESIRIPTMQMGSKVIIIYLECHLLQPSATICIIIIITITITITIIIIILLPTKVKAL